jgi:hypothetical protein
MTRLLDRLQPPPYPGRVNRKNGQYYLLRSNERKIQTPPALERALPLTPYRLNGPNGQIRAFERWNFSVRAVPLAQH